MSTDNIHLKTVAYFEKRLKNDAVLLSTVVLEKCCSFLSINDCLKEGVKIYERYLYV